MPDLFEQLKQKYQPVLDTFKRKVPSYKTSTSMEISCI
jgi:hypothetical protein